MGEGAALPLSGSAFIGPEHSSVAAYTRKGGHDASEPGEDDRVDAEDFVARILVQIPEPRRHVVRFYGT